MLRNYELRNLTLKCLQKQWTLGSEPFYHRQLATRPTTTHSAIQLQFRPASMRTPMEETLTLTGPSTTKSYEGKKATTADKKEQTDGNNPEPIIIEPGTWSAMNGQRFSTKNADQYDTLDTLSDVYGEPVRPADNLCPADDHHSEDNHQNEGVEEEKQEEVSLEADDVDAETNNTSSDSDAETNTGYSSTYSLIDYNTSSDSMKSDKSEEESGEEDGEDKMHDEPDGQMTGDHDNSSDAQRLNRPRRRRNLPTELKVEIVDCLPVENAVHFLANVPSQLTTHYCAPRVRRMLQTIDQIAADYPRPLPKPDTSDDRILLENGHHYTPEIDIFLRYGIAHCRGGFFIPRHTRRVGFFGCPANFFDDLIKHYYETKVPEKAIRYMHIDLPLDNPAPWPAALVQPQAGKMNVEVLKVQTAYNGWKCVLYNLRNKHKPAIAFKLSIYSEIAGKCYQQMTAFNMRREKDVQSDVQYGEA